MKKLCISVLLLLFGISLIGAAECGDVNSDGSVDILDALLIAQYYVGLNPSNFDSTVADVNCDGQVDIVDALLVAQLYVDLISQLDCCEPDTPTPTPETDTPTPTPIEETVFAVNCGGSAYTASDGTEYAADTGYSGGTAYDNGASVSGTSDPILYSTERYGSCTYSVSVPNGDFLVTLHFAENYHTSSGSRAFDVNIEGTQVINDLDIYAQAGGNTAYVTEDQIAVSDGELNIEFVTVTENALINAIKVDAIAFTGEPIVRFTVSPSHAQPGETVTVDASDSYDPDGSITNYQVNWGDGNTSSGAVTTHSYAEGTYTITVTVTDNDGKTASDSKQITVSEIDMSRLRLMYSTDFPDASTRITNSDPDDVQSMVRLLLHSNEFDIEGLIASAATSSFVANKNNILYVLDRYDQVDENLRTHDPNYPTAAYLRSVTYQGMGNEGPINIQWNCENGHWSDIIGSGRDSEASDAIIAAGDKDDPRPIFMGFAGGPREVAQAIWKVQDTRSAAEAAEFIGKFRLFLIHCQDATNQWLMDVPDLFVVWSRTTYQGMFGVDDYNWIHQNIIDNHGALCALYPDYDYQGNSCGVREGDSPSFMWLLSANRGINDPEDPTQPSWGGYYNPIPGETNKYGGPDHQGPTSSISQWANDFQPLFAERADWCVQ